MPAPPPLIITTDIDPLCDSPAQTTLNTATSPSPLNHTPPRRTDPSHLSPHHLSPPGHSPSASWSSSLTPPSPTLTNTSVHFADENEASSSRSRSHSRSPSLTPSFASNSSRDGVQATTLALRSNNPTRESGADTLRMGHRRGGSGATWSSGTQQDSEDDTSSNRTLVSRWRAKVRRKKSRDSSRDAGENERDRPHATLDPDADQTDPAPFRENPSRLASLVDPKSLESLEKIRGIDGLLEGLGVDRRKGLLVGAEEAREVEEGGSRGDASGDTTKSAQWQASMDNRRAVYGRNDLPKRPTKGLLLLMWIAFKDKVLVSG